MKRIFDFTFSLIGLFVLSPLFILFMIIIWLQDFNNPFYISPRVCKNGAEFKMIKLRSMIVRINNLGPDSTSSDDKRITKVGYFIRKFKFDELSQLFNVLIGDMSLVGPRPNVKNETDLYTDLEKKLLSVKPGITDFASIVFSDEGSILESKSDPDLAYNQLIRPWKSRLGLVYIESKTLILDFQLIFYTLVSIVSKSSALFWINKKLKKLNVDDNLLEISCRQIELYPYPPPGSKKVVLTR